MDIFTTSLITAVIVSLLNWLGIWIKNRLSRADASDYLKEVKSRDAMMQFMLYYRNRLNENAPLLELLQYSDACMSMIAWSRDGVLRRYGNFKLKKFPEHYANPRAHEIEFGEALIQFRKSVGHRCWRLKPEQVLAVFKSGYTHPL